MTNSPLSLYTLIRSRRKTASLSVVSGGEVVVRAPNHMPLSAIEAFVGKHSSWIEKHRIMRLEKEAEHVAFAWADGDEVPMLGAKYMLASGGVGTQVQLVGGNMVLPEYTVERVSAVRQFYCDTAKDLLPNRCAYFAEKMSLHPSGIKITSARSRWGSCNGKNSICFSWRLVCLPIRLIDAIVVHELAHIAEKNHSSAFYNVVKRYLPDYNERKAELRIWEKNIPI